MSNPTDLHLESSGAVTTIKIRRPPNNYFDLALIRQIAETLEALDDVPGCRAVVLAAQGKAFCAGANFADRPAQSADAGRANASSLYGEAVRIFRTRKPIVAAVHGAAIGGGLGLAMAADFRVTCPEAQFSANFTKLGFHPGFGLTVTLPETLGATSAALMMLTSRRVTGEEAYAMGLASILVPQAEVRDAALRLAQEIAGCAPLALVSARATLRAGLADRVAKATEHELDEQSWLRATEDFKEGVEAWSERRQGNFQGR